MKQNRRQFYRHALQVPVILGRQTHPPLPVLTHDLSMGGLGFYGHEQLEPGEPVSVHIPAGGQQFRIEGRVVYTRRDKSRSRYRIGISFLDRSRKFRERFAEDILGVLEDYHDFQDSLARTSRLGLKERVLSLLRLFPGHEENPLS